MSADATQIHDELLVQFRDKERTYNTKHTHQAVELVALETSNQYLFYIYYLVAILLVYTLVSQTAYNRYIKGGISVVILSYPYIISPILTWLYSNYQFVVSIIRGEVAQEPVDI